MLAVPGVVLLIPKFLVLNYLGMYTGWRRPARPWSSTAARARWRGAHRTTPVTGLLERYPRLQLVIAHLGMPEYRDFLELAERYERVHLDTTMFATDFTERLMPFDLSLRDRPGA